MSRTKRVIRPDRVNSTGECTIYILYTHRSKNTYISTGEQVLIKNWDKKEGLVKRSHRGFTNLNNFIEQVQATVDEIKRELITEKVDPDVQLVKSRYVERNQPTEVVSKDFFPSLDDFIDYKEHVENNRPSTVKQYKSFRTHLKNFEKHWRKRLNFNLINSKFYVDYLDFLFDEVDMSDNTAGSQIKQLKVFMNWCLTNNRSVNQEFKKFKKPSTETNIVALTEEEFVRFFNHQFQNPRLEKVRDAFIFSCTTGLRFSDYSRVDENSIVGDQIIMHSIKTGQELRIPLHDYSKTLLEKYDFKLDIISNQKTNEYLKLAAKEAGLGGIREIKSTKGREVIMEKKPLHEIISTHMGRKTFITMMLDKGYPYKDVMAISGHKSLSSFQRYMGVSEKRLKEHMTNAFRITKPLSPTMS
ncbi:MAG: tyrosine-type recombinase/integrase [Cyclobacteriaceae bacterium]